MNAIRWKSGRNSVPIVDSHPDEDMYDSDVQTSAPNYPLTTYGHMCGISGSHHSSDFCVCRCVVCKQARRRYEMSARGR